MTKRLSLDVFKSNSKKKKNVDSTKTKKIEIREKLPTCKYNSNYANLSLPHFSW